MIDTPSKIHFHAGKSSNSQGSLAELEKIYGQSTPEECDVIVALGGDGTLLRALHRYHGLEKPFYGMNLGSVGFLLNPYKPENLLERLAQTQEVRLHPLRMTATTINDKQIENIAFNEVALLRQRHFAAKVSIDIDNVTRMEELICDGVLVSTAAGSTAYNFSAHGPILPLSSGLLALTPISAFRPRRWRGALLPHHVDVTFNIHDSDDRLVSATADFHEVRDVKTVEIHESRSIYVSLLSDPDNKFEERVLKEQFLP